MSNILGKAAVQREHESGVIRETTCKYSVTYYCVGPILPTTYTESEALKGSYPWSSQPIEILLTAPDYQLRMPEALQADHNAKCAASGHHILYDAVQVH